MSSSSSSLMPPPRSRPVSPLLASCVVPTEFSHTAASCTISSIEQRDTKARPGDGPAAAAPILPAAVQEHSGRTLPPPALPVGFARIENATRDAFPFAIAPPVDTRPRRRRRPRRIDPRRPAPAHFYAVIVLPIA